ncbi:MAG: hypothetical protein LLG14_16805 [Nocardiaceae bacterium]|nr:hypothetical protein [Nocardiaceae bacterium]
MGDDSFANVDESETPRPEDPAPPAIVQLRPRPARRRIDLLSAHGCHQLLERAVIGVSA